MTSRALLNAPRAMAMANKTRLGGGRRGMSNIDKPSSSTMPSGFIAQATGALMILGGVAYLLNPPTKELAPVNANSESTRGGVPATPVTQEPASLVEGDKVQASIQQAIAEDAPKFSAARAGATNRLAPKERDAIIAAVNADAPKSAKAAEEKSALSQTQKGKEGDGGVIASIKQSLRADDPKTAKKAEAEESKGDKGDDGVGASIAQSIRADDPKTAKKAEEQKAKQK